MKAAALVTVGKGVTFRDHSQVEMRAHSVTSARAHSLAYQAVWRMRGIGKGQTGDVLVTDETVKLIKKELAAVGVPCAAQPTMNDLVSWLLAANMRLECMQQARDTGDTSASLSQHYCFRADPTFDTVARTTWPTRRVP